MKPVNFFITKSESFLNELNSIEIEKYSHNLETEDIYKDSIESDNNKFRKQKEKLDEFEFQINLMLTEFDNGELFIEKLKDYKPIQRFFNNSHQLNQLSIVIKSFIEYLKEYRV